MTTQHTAAQSYTLPAALALAEAGDRAEQYESDQAAAARAACLLLAATVRDLLTDCDHDAPFDATALELRLNPGPGTVSATGFYWTTEGERQEFQGAEDRYHLQGWAHYLTTDNQDTWEQLCTVTDGGTHATRYRLDLIRASAS
ncbi:hypothetical protein [Streptomyces sp. NBC_01244]|uniref:hypothetical protein n=1 Tax=Streptomyces sp. NBC_01244 TaxID=2903797 RepID=UPI002E100550|nr:hypothetical protein OG247_43880 [Streptomyces sp. NBC_01244]